MNKRAILQSFFALIRYLLRNANLESANLSGANLSHADLREAEINNAEMIYATLIGTYLIGANLNDSDMSGSIFVSANMRLASFWSGLCARCFRFFAIILAD